MYCIWLLGKLYFVVMHSTFHSGYLLTNICHYLRSIDEDYNSDEEDIISNGDSDNDDTLELQEHVAMETSDPIEGDSDFTTKKEEIIEMKMNWLVGFFKREMVT